MVQPPVTAEASVNAAAASAIAVDVEEPQPDVPDGSASSASFAYVRFMPDFAERLAPSAAAVTSHAVAI